MTFWQLGHHGDVAVSVGALLFGRFDERAKITIGTRNPNGYERMTDVLGGLTETADALKEEVISEESYELCLSSLACVGKQLPCADTCRRSGTC